MKNDDFRSPFGTTILDVSVIFIKLQGGFQLMMDIWSRSIWQGPCSGFKDLKGGSKEAITLIGGSTLDAQNPLGG